MKNLDTSVAAYSDQNIDTYFNPFDTQCNGSIYEWGS